jgi:hypothetical protein
MRTLWRFAITIGAIVHQLAGSSAAGPGPFDGTSFKGRIAYSCDGNDNDQDDWAASPVALAVLAEFGVKDRLVHFDYNCILPHSDPEWERIHAASVRGAAQRYGYDLSVFHDCRKNLDAAVDSIAAAINASSADDPLYFIVAGPVQVPLMGIEKADAGKRKYVYCISHSRWNDGYATRYAHVHTKRSVIATGVRWVQIRDQNALLSTSPYGRAARADAWRPWHWMRDSEDSKVRFLWERMLASTRPDCSDAGMAYFLLTGDDQADPDKLNRLLDGKAPPSPIKARAHLRLEAENFQELDGYVVEDRNDRAASHRLNVLLADGSTVGRIRTRFDEPYTVPSARYDVEVCYRAERGGGRMALSINGVRQGAPWQVAADQVRWQSHAVADVPIDAGAEISVELKAEGKERVRLDYVQLNARLQGE